MVVLVDLAAPDSEGPADQEALEAPMEVLMEVPVALAAPGVPCVYHLSKMMKLD
jgi:hypothetical protein